MSVEALKVSLQISYKYINPNASVYSAGFAFQIPFPELIIPPIKVNYSCEVLTSYRFSLVLI